MQLSGRTLGHMCYEGMVSLQSFWDLFQHALSCSPVVVCCCGAIHHEALSELVQLLWNLQTCELNIPLLLLVIQPWGFHNRHKPQTNRTLITNSSQTLTVMCRLVTPYPHLHVEFLTCSTFTKTVFRLKIGPLKCRLKPCVHAGGLRSTLGCSFSGGLVFIFCILRKGGRRGVVVFDLWAASEPLHLCKVKVIESHHEAGRKQAFLHWTPRPLVL